MNRNTIIHAILFSVILCLSGNTAFSQLKVKGDNGEAYYQKVDNVSSFNFQNISKPYNVTITKHNYYPYLFNPNDLYIQNVNWDNERVISANRFFIGTDVTNNIPFGNVIINAPANILLKPIEDVIIQSDFEVVSGASFEIKINNNDENTCL